MNARNGSKKRNQRSKTALPRIVETDLEIPPEAEINVKGGKACNKTNYPALVPIPRRPKGNNSKC